MKTVTVNLNEYSYDIIIGRDILNQISVYLSKFDNIKIIHIITDQKVSKHHLSNLIDILKSNNINSNVLILNGGERSKNWNNLKKTTDWLIKNKVERRDFVIALGGGVIGDLVSLTASLVRRGIKVIHVPTTLLAQVDSAIGGKTSINSIHGKNLIGTFHQPSLVLSDISTLKTLNIRDFRSGYGEVVKYSLIKDAIFFNWLEKQTFSKLSTNEGLLIQMVERSSKIKAEIVETDEKEQGIRTLLNFGHTFGHALESVTGYSKRLLHGEGVILESCLALNLSNKLNLIGKEEIARLEESFMKCGFKT